MNDVTKQALLDSIKNWKIKTHAKSIDKFDVHSSQPLCELFRDSNCSGCPVAAPPFKSICRNKWWYDVYETTTRWRCYHGGREPAIKASKNYVKFLESLLPKETRMKITKDGKYGTKEHPATEIRIYAIDGYGDYPIHGAYYEDGNWCIEKWTEYGKSYHDAPYNDIVPFKLTPKGIYVWRHENGTFDDKNYTSIGRIVFDYENMPGDPVLFREVLVTI